MSDTETIDNAETTIIGECDIGGGSTQAPNQLQASFWFPTGIYTIDKPEWLETIGGVAREYLKKAEKEHKKNTLGDKLYPVTMTENHANDERIREMVTFIAQSGWNILNEQGYDMQNFNVVVYDWWLQDHHMHSAMDEHIHNFGIQLTGFYFLECPPDCSRVVIHDARPGKKQINLPEKNVSNATYASTAINFEPKAGQFMLAPAWLPHSFSRHGSKKPFRFIHINLGVVNVPPISEAPATAEIV